MLHQGKDFAKGNVACCRTDGCNWNQTTANGGTSLTQLLDAIAKANVTSSTAVEEASVAWIPLVIIGVVVFIFIIFCIVCICYKYVKSSPSDPAPENMSTRVKEAVTFFVRVL